MRQGDEIVAVDGESTAGSTAFQVATLIRAPPSAPDARAPGLAAVAALQSGASAKAESQGAGGAAEVRAGEAAEVRVVQHAEVRVVHAEGAEEVLSVPRGRNAAVANPVAGVALRGGSGYVRLRTFNARAVPELQVRSLPPSPAALSPSLLAPCGPCSAPHTLSLFPTTCTAPHTLSHRPFQPSAPCAGLQRCLSAVHACRQPCGTWRSGARSRLCWIFPTTVEAWSRRLWRLPGCSCPAARPWCRPRTSAPRL